MKIAKSYFDYRMVAGGGFFHFVYSTALRIIAIMENNIILCCFFSFCHIIIVRWIYSIMYFVLQNQDVFFTITIIIIIAIMLKFDSIVWIFLRSI